MQLLMIHIQQWLPAISKPIIPLLQSLFLQVTLIVLIMHTASKLKQLVTTVTKPTPVHPVLTYPRHSKVIRIIPKHSMPLPNPLALSQANLHLSNALLNTLTPLCLVNTFLTRHSFNLSSSSHQVNSRHPHSFLTRRHSTFTLLCQVYSQRLIGLVTAVGRSPITYLSHSMHLSLSFLTLYISVCSLCLIARYPSFVSSVLSSVPRLH